MWQVRTKGRHGREVASHAAPQRDDLVAERVRHNDVVVVGAHGGAGTSTLAELLRPAWDMGVLSALVDPSRSPLDSGGRPVVVACRDTVGSAKHATWAVTLLNATGEHIAALVITSDGTGPEPRDATARFELLTGRVDGVVRMPFVPAYRQVDTPMGVLLTGRAERAVGHVRELIDR